jgi:hypothetical protein
MTSDVKRSQSGKFVAAGKAPVPASRGDTATKQLPKTLAELLESQYYVIAREQALQYKITQYQIRHRLQPGGSWQKILPGVYSTLTGQVSLDQLQMGALLFAGPGAVMTGAHAVRRHRLICSGGNEVDILVPPSCQVSSCGYARIHRTQRMPERTFSTRGIRFAPLVRAVGDAARLMVKAEEAKSLVCEAAQKGRCSLEDLIAECATGPSIGSRVFRAALAELGEDIRSQAEHDVKARVERSGLDKPMYNARLYLPDGTFLGMVDEWWPRAGVGLEVDSRQYHMSRKDYSETTDRHNRIEAAGARLLHVLPMDVKEKWKSTIYENLRDAIASGNRRPPPEIIAVPHHVKDVKTFLQTRRDS